MRITKYVLLTLLILSILSPSVFLLGCLEEDDTIISGSTLRPDNFPGTTVDEEALAEDGKAFSNEPETSDNEIDSSSDEPKTTIDKPEIIPGLTIDPVQVNFGIVCVGECKSIKMKVTNSGNCDLKIKPYSLMNSPFLASIYTSVLVSGASLTYNIEFCPEKAGKFDNTFKLDYKYTVNGKEQEGSKSAGLSGEGAACEPEPWNAYVNELDLTYITIKPCTCPTWPACGCGPGTYAFTLLLSIMGDNSVPIPGANVTLHATGPGNDKTIQVTTDTAGKAQTTFNTSTTNTGKFTVVVTDITGQYDDREMEYTEEKNIVNEASTTTQ